MLFVAAEILVFILFIANESHVKHHYCKTEFELDSQYYININMADTVLALIGNKVYRVDFATTSPTGSFGKSWCRFDYIGRGKTLAYDGVLSHDTTTYYYFRKVWVYKYWK